MPSDFKRDQPPLQGLLEDEPISFNIKRSVDNYSRFPRKVTLLHALQQKRTIIPSIKERSERNLVKELKIYQNWRQVRRHSFEIGPHLFSFLWRFRRGHQFVFNEVEAIKPLGKNEAKRAIVAYRNYQAALRHNFTPGHVYLFPDSEIVFQDPNRFKMPYARRILLLNVQNGQLVMAPFTSKLRWMNKETDILFDSAQKGQRLDPFGTPAVENFPYKIFSRKAVLRVEVAQAMRAEDFMGAALISLGALNNDLMDFVRQKMKNL